MKQFRVFFSVRVFFLVLLAAMVGIVTQSSATRTGVGQQSQRDRDLSRAFTKYEIGKLDAGDAVREVRSNRRLVLALADRTLELNLEPNDMRAANYRAVETNASGSYDLEPQPVRTYKGSIVGQPDTDARFTIDEHTVEGLILTADKEYFVESARKFSAAAAADELVFYERADFRNPVEMHCETSLVNRVGLASQQLDQGVQRPAVFRVIELATETDLAFVQLLGNSAPAANNEILALMNQVDAAYRRDLNLTFTITFQHAWTTADPFVGATPDEFLRSLRDYWNANNTAVMRDHVHLFSGRTGGSFQGAGRTFTGVVCRTPTSAYGFSTRVGQQPQDYILVAHEIGHAFSATHPTAPGCGETVMTPSIGPFNSGIFCAASIAEITTYVGNNSVCLANQVLTRNRFDYDGDNKADLTVFRPGEGAWYRINSSNGGFVATPFGAQGDRPVPGDYDGDGKADIAVYRPSAGGWYMLLSATGAFRGVGFGVNSDTAVPADFDGDGKTDIAVYRPADGAWYILNSADNSFRVVNFGLREDNPAPQDFDGDGKADIAVFRNAIGSWYRLNSTTGALVSVQFGAPNDKPIPGDFDGDGKADLALYRTADGGWYRLNSGNGAFVGVAFGTATDRPVAADYDGDGKTDIAVYRGATGNWFQLLSATNAFAVQTFGAPGDLPAPASFVP